MNWKTLEGFDEKLAKVSFKAHKTFDGKVVEVCITKRGPK